MPKRMIRKRQKAEKDASIIKNRLDQHDPVCSYVRILIGYKRIIRSAALYKKRLFRYVKLLIEYLKKAGRYDDCKD